MTKHTGMPAAILTADWHIRDDTPKCRTDDFQKAQWIKIQTVFDLASDLHVPILIAGDLGHRPLWPNDLQNKFIQYYNVNEPRIHCVPGQHDLPNHNLDNFDKSGIGVLDEAGIVKYGGTFKLDHNVKICVEQFPYGAGVTHPPLLVFTGKSVNAAMVHQMVIKDDPLWPGQKAQTGLEMLKNHPEYDLILTGDNHIPFTVRHGNRLLVNAGSLTRQRASEVNHKPRVYVWFPESNTVVPHYLQIKKLDVTEKHIKIVKERDERMTAYVRSLKEQKEVSLSFTDNIEEELSINNIRKPVERKVRDAISS